MGMRWWPLLTLAAVKALAGAEDAWTHEAVGLVLDRDR